MDRLSAEQQADIKKMPTERLIARLARAGVDEEKIGEMDRAQMLDMWAEFVSTGRDKPTVVGESISRPVTTGFDPELQRRMFDLEMMKFEEDRKEREARRRREDEEREERRRLDEERRRKEEEERRLRDEEREERRRKEDEEKEERRKKEEEEKEERRQRQEMERELRLRELKIREDELARQTRRDRDEAEKRQSLAARTKFFSEAMKNVFWKFPNDPAEIPGYFEHVENLFSMYEVET